MRPPRRGHCPHHNRHDEVGDSKDAPSVNRSVGASRISGQQRSHDDSKRPEQNGVVERRFYSMSPPRAEYVLTAKGRDLGPIVGAMRSWGRKYAR
jgi:hypothetical protein